MTKQIKSKSKKNPSKASMKVQQTISKNSVFNKVVLSIFIFIIASTIILRFVTSALTDLGYDHGVFHVGFDDGSKKSRAFLEDLANHNGGVLPLEWQLRVKHHPYFFWALTQFTWQTTFIVFIVILFRFFSWKYVDKPPKWIRWTMTQKTLSWVTMYDTIVMIIFWVGIYSTFENAFPSDKVLRTLEMIVTISVHAVIPILMLLYSITYSLFNKNASFLREIFLFKGMIYPTFYLLFYILAAFIWTDPYAVTDLQQSIGWWKVGVLYIVIYIMLGLMIIFHNTLFAKFNKNFNEEIKDFDAKMIELKKQQKNENKMKLESMIINNNKK